MNKISIAQLDQSFKKKQTKNKQNRTEQKKNTNKQMKHKQTNKQANKLTKAYYKQNIFSPKLQLQVKLISNIVFLIC